MQGVLYVQVVLFKLLDSLMFQGLCLWKFVMKSFVLLITCKQKYSHSEKVISSPEL